ncbi:outer dynein arm-docking complex subunit 4-like [Gigantopelta aegis]|uniref:outer dynein arm-docking complex subunit 4-like n=1 Tax=Gigantopelta aegis TaxID=1735272 RepID=UPI001B88DAB6|nr:outer dynein arm-docking complex subunit 4-like [Gigantopelta aegis]
MYEEGSEGPKATFEIYKAEADTLYKQGDYKKAIESYTIALEIQHNDKTCLVARSKCHLQLGDTNTALKDAESSLANDNTYHKGVYQKAEALYYKGEFELALMFYHRGNKLRPELKEFRLGIQKAQEAIDNSIGSAEKVKLTTKGDLSFFREQDEVKKRRPVFATFAPQQQQQKAKTKRYVISSTSSEKTIKELLGELYGDRKYLEKLLKETDNSTNTGRTIYDLVESGLLYLDTRTDFWRQQKPMYARKYESMRQRRNHSGAKGASPNDYIMNELEKIDAAQSNGQYALSLKRAQKCLKTVDNYSNESVPNKLEVVANLHSYIGNAYLELGQYKKALQHHSTDLELGEKGPIEDAKSRGLDNLGRVYARIGSFDKAIEVWERKLPMSKTALECTWLYHEIGRCHLELHHYDTAKQFGEKSLTAAEEANDTVWQLQASVLIAQSEVKLGDLQAALASFEKSMDFAKLQEDVSAQNAIKKAMEDVNNRIVQSLKGSDAEQSDTDQTDSKSKAKSATVSEKKHEDTNSKDKSSTKSEVKQGDVKSRERSAAKSEVKPEDTKSRDKSPSKSEVKSEDAKSRQKSATKTEEGGES